MLQTITFAIALSLPLLIADIITGTTWFQRKDIDMDGFTRDQLDEMLTEEEELENLITATLVIPGLALAADEMVRFTVLTDTEMAQIDADIDNGVYDGFDTDEDRDEWFYGEFYSDSLAAQIADEQWANDNSY